MTSAAPPQQWGTGLDPPRPWSPPALPGCRAPLMRAESDAPRRASASCTPVQVWPLSHHRLSRAASDPVVFFHARFLSVSGRTRSPPSPEPGGDPAGPAGTEEPGPRRGGSAIPKEGWDQPRTVPAGKGCCCVGSAEGLLRLLPLAGIRFLTAFLCCASLLSAADLGACKAGLESG